ncbi:hypothetical protein OSW16_08855 [Pseudomonas putida]|uniref:TnsA endonuclease N-terminal domain-containing protein n=1 Tax=Pseudomonas putida TaxID=303 RepID=UPI00226FE647|nr:TnsA endonuclease N-terminal domain-containing protein [Pseudomonas putida]WAB99731.1 hypothetical protein OSW16_08855 [Pseudomonas putida]
MEIPIGLHKPEKCGYYGKHLLFFPSRKNRRQEICNSVLEADYCVLLEWDKQVVHYDSQPGVLEVRVGGHKQRYRPDFRVETSESTYFTEVKYDFETIHPTARAKLWAASEMLAEKGYRLAFADSRSIRCGHRLTNLKFLYFHSFNVSDEEKVDCHRWLGTFTYPVRLRELIYPDAAVRERAIYRALFEGKISVDFNEQMTFNSLVEQT